MNATTAGRRVIGAALAFLGIDGLIAPSARWDCDNLMIFQSNHLLTERLEIAAEETVDWVEMGASERI